MKKKIAAKTALSSVVRREFCVLFLFTMIASFATAQQKVVQLYEGVAPGSENWNWDEKEATNPMNFRVVYNVVKPTLLVFSPDSPNRTGIIVCPAGLGGLNIEHEGINVARELNKKGITAFVLKYRVIRNEADDPWQGVLRIIRDTSSLMREKKAEILKLQLDDLITAMNYVRKNASEYNVAANKIGVIGFSAGGSRAATLSLDGNPETRPNFAGLIYSGPIATENISATTPPVFIACAADDTVVAKNAIKLYTAWKAANLSVELHIYSKGGHGLRFPPGNTWIHRLEEWLKNEGF